MNARQRQALIDAARTGAPCEVCGLIGGIARGETAFARQVIAVPNESGAPETSYYMARAPMVAAMFAIERARQALVGIYHSHPAGAALPSAADVAEATWPDVAYVIIGLGAAGEPEVRAWRLQHGQAREVRLNYADG